MPQAERPSFSKTVLDLSERAQHAFGHTRVGQIAIREVVGSKAPTYKQLDWFSQNVSAQIKKTVKVPGDPGAGRLARNWNNAMVMAATNSEIVDIKDQIRPWKYNEAVAYVSEEVAHVGIRAAEGALYGNLTDEELAIAMRLGRGSLEATMGLWLPGERAFVGVENVKVVEPKLPVSALVHEYPWVPLG